MPVRRDQEEYHQPDWITIFSVMRRAGAPLWQCLIGLAFVPGRVRHIARYARFRRQVLIAKTRIIELLRARNRQILQDNEIPLHTINHIRRAWLHPDRRVFVQAMALEDERLLEEVQAVADIVDRLAFTTALRELYREGLLADAPGDTAVSGSILLVVRPHYPTYPIESLSALLPRVDYRRRYHDHHRNTTKGEKRTYGVD